MVSNGGQQWGRAAIRSCSLRGKNSFLHRSWHTERGLAADQAANQTCDQACDQAVRKTPGRIARFEAFPRPASRRQGWFRGNPPPFARTWPLGVSRPAGLLGPRARQDRAAWAKGAQRRGRGAFFAKTGGLAMVCGYGRGSGSFGKGPCHPPARPESFAGVDLSEDA